MTIEDAKDTAFHWVERNQPQWSAWNSHIWDLAETAWREYRSAEWYVATLRAEGFSVEEGSGGMPTAFSAHWSNGEGPTVMAYAEYDAVPGNCQIADTYRAPRKGLSRFAGGHTDPHSALGMGAFVGRARRQGGDGEARHHRHHPLHGRARREGEGLEAHPCGARLL